MTNTIPLSFRTVRRLSEYRLKYPSELNYQRAYFELLHEDTEVYVTFDAEIGGGIPFSVYHGKDRRWYFSPKLKLGIVNKLGRELLPLFERVRSGLTVDWDGYNMTGSLTDDAQKANDEIEAIIERTEMEELFNA